MAKVRVARKNEDFRRAGRSVRHLKRTRPCTEAKKRLVRHLVRLSIDGEAFLWRQALFCKRSGKLQATCYSLFVRKQFPIFNWINPRPFHNRKPKLILSRLAVESLTCLSILPEDTCQA